MGDNNKISIEDACDKNYEKNKNNCSGFVKAVAKELGYALPSGNADSIMENLPKNKWERIPDGASAERLAAKGVFVIVGLKSKDHMKEDTHYGHVSVVIKGNLVEGKYPLVWSGSIGGPVAQSKGNKSVARIWRRADAANVKYYAPPGTLAKLKAEQDGKNASMDGGTLK